MFFLCFPYVLPTIIPAFSYDSYDFRFSEIQSESSVSILSYSHSHTFAYGNSPYIFLQSFSYVSYGHSIRFCPRRFRRMPLLKAAFLSFPTTYDLHTFSYDSISSSLCLCDHCFLLFSYVLHTVSYGFRVGIPRSRHQQYFHTFPFVFHTIAFSSVGIQFPLP